MRWDVNSRNVLTASYDCGVLWRIKCSVLAEGVFFRGFSS
jgi:hypothetical protein